MTPPAHNAVNSPKLCPAVISGEIPNGFSPNGDGKNDTWDIPGLVPYSDVNISVFNRWGSAVYESSYGYKEPWDGTGKSGNTLTPGTYFYVITSASEKEINYSGTVTIIK